MNPIQKAWLKVLSPISYFVNEKLAKRSGLLGKIGRFFLIGPREFGYHPFNKAFIFMNRRYMLAQAVMAHRYSILKGLTHNGYQMMRPMRTVAFIAPIIVLTGFMRFVFFRHETKDYQPDTLEYVMKRTTGNFQLPLNTMNQRQSAHYTEIATIYAAEMGKRFGKTSDAIIEERRTCDETERKTRYADPSYVYEPMTPVHVPEFKLI